MVPFQSFFLFTTELSTHLDFLFMYIFMLQSFIIFSWCTEFLCLSLTLNFFLLLPKTFAKKLKSSIVFLKDLIEKVRSIEKSCFEVTRRVNNCFCKLHDG